MKFSIITAVYNAEATVGEAIASVAAQTYSDLEHIVVEGASPDGSLKAIQTAAHPRMDLKSEPDAGIYDALNKGIFRATGDVIGFVHSDDFLAHSDVLRRVADAFDAPQTEAVFANLDYVSQGDTSRVVRHWATGPFTPQKLRRGWMPAHPTLFVRRAVYERIGVFDTSFQIAADYDFILRYFCEEPRTAYLPEVTYKMRLGGVSNRDVSRIRLKMGEDLRALRQNGVGSWPALVWKNISKVRQFASAS